jgi:AcrR family transcriptional regulator
MSTLTDRRSRKRLATRQTISTIATRLFMERGFDAVTVDEIAEAADVGRVTVFNHFPRKEDMFFDRELEGRELLASVVQGRDAGVSAIEALHLLARRLVSDQAPYVELSPMSRRFAETIEGSETLKARARAIRDDLARTVAGLLTESVGEDVTDPIAHLAAGMLLASWATGVIEAHRLYRRSGDARGAHESMLAIVDRGVAGLKAAMAGTPYA